MKFKGIAASPGVAIGRAYLISEESYCVIKRAVGSGQVKKEVNRFKKAVGAVDGEFRQQREKVALEMGKTYARLFDAYSLILKDPLFYKDTIKIISEEQVNVEYALQTVIDRITKTFSILDDEYMRDRIRDVQDVGNRVMRVLLGHEHVSMLDIQRRVVLVAHALHPSDTVEMKKENVIGFVTDVGGKTSHVVIMAESLEIPAVVGLKRITRHVSPGDLLIIDGDTGFVHVNPDPDTVRSYRKKKRRQEARKKELVKLRDRPSVMRCGTGIELTVNIESSREVSAVREYGAAGVGLYRTEYLYINRKELPVEEEIYENMKKVADECYPHNAVIRTVDLGADKMSEQLGIKPEGTPFMGMRGIRLCLAYPGLFKTQLRAILRASVKKNVSIMYPMITGIKELRAANHILREVCEELDNGGIEYDRDIKTGVMIETPAAVMDIEGISAAADFLSIGTNDLIQYTLAVDRVSDSVSHLYNPSDLAILRMIEKAINGASRAGKPIGMCGEMASERLYTELLIGMGLRSFSMSGIAVPAIKHLIINTGLEKCRQLAERVMGASDTEEVMDILKENRETRNF